MAKQTARQRACIYAARMLIGALASAGKRARKRLEKAAAKHGGDSDEYYAARAGYEETERLIRRIFPILDVRLMELGAPYRKSMDEWSR